MLRPLKNFVIVDTETTGLKPDLHRIIEVGAVRVVNGEIESKYQTLVKSVFAVPSFITNITGITRDMLLNEGRKPEFVFSELREFIGDLPFVAHNVEFDYRFLNYEFNRYNLPVLNNPKVCTVRIMRKSEPDLINHKLTTIKEFLQLDLKSHRALEDVMVCYEIMKRYWSE